MKILVLLLILISNLSYADNYGDDGVICYSDVKLNEQMKTLGGGIQSAGGINHSYDHDYYLGSTIQFACVGTWTPTGRVVNDLNEGVYQPGDECQLVCPVLISRDGKRSLDYSTYAIRLSRTHAHNDDEYRQLFYKKYLQGFLDYKGYEHQNRSEDYGMIFQTFFAQKKRIVVSSKDNKSWNWSNEPIQVNTSAFINFKNYAASRSRIRVYDWFY